jgi:KH domain
MVTDTFVLHQLTLE